MPSNLDPPLERADGDKRGARTVVLFGDSHAGQWFPALDGAAKARHWRLVSLTKSTCPPVSIALWSPVLHRPYHECDRWRDAALDRIRAEKPLLVVMGIARHYGPEYRFGAGSAGPNRHAAGPDDARLRTWPRPARSASLVAPAVRRRPPARPIASAAVGSGQR